MICGNWLLVVSYGVHLMNREWLPAQRAAKVTCLETEGNASHNATRALKLPHTKSAVVAPPNAKKRRRQSQTQSDSTGTATTTIFSSDGGDGGNHPSEDALLLTGWSRGLRRASASEAANATAQRNAVAQQTVAQLLGQARVERHPSGGLGLVTEGSAVGPAYAAMNDIHLLAMQSAAAAALGPSCERPPLPFNVQPGMLTSSGAAGRRTTSSAAQGMSVPNENNIDPSGCLLVLAGQSMDPDCTMGTASRWCCFVLLPVPQQFKMQGRCTPSPMRLSRCHWYRVCQPLRFSRRSLRMLPRLLRRPAQR